MIEAGEVTGVVLAGGKSSRMLQDKALLAYDGRTFLQSVTDVLGEVFPRVFVVAASVDAYRISGVTVHADLFHDVGPLGGIHAALSHAQTTHVFIATCDVPLLRGPLLRAVLAEAQPGSVTVAHDGDRKHPLIGVYPVSLRDHLHATLTSQTRKVEEFLGSVKPPVTVVQLPEFREMMRNINTPEEYAQFSGG